MPETKTLEQQASEALALIATKPLRQTYQGKVGCMCGCMGSYSENPGVAKRRMKKVQDLIDNGQLTEVDLAYSRLNAADYAYFAYKTDAGTDKCFCFYFSEETK